MTQLRVNPEFLKTATIIAWTQEAKRAETHKIHSQRNMEDIASSADAATHIAQAAKAAFEASQLIPPSERVKALHEIKKELENSKADILEANRKDLEVRHRGPPQAR